MGRTYDKELKCGCLLSNEGSGGLIPCYAEWGDMNDEKDRDALDLHNKCWAKFEKSKEYKDYFPPSFEDDGDEMEVGEDE